MWTHSSPIIPDAPCCDICEERDAVHEAPEKCKAVFCRKCVEKAKKMFDLSPADIDFI